MSASSLKLCLGIAAWSGLLIGSLSIVNLPGDWGHGICGPWGCGPPTQALIACHLAWLVGLALPAVFILRASRGMRLRVGLFLTFLSLAVLMSVVVYQRLSWWPVASEWQRPYFWQRCAFSIATAVDMPIAQTLVVGLVIVLSLKDRRAQSFLNFFVAPVSRKRTFRSVLVNGEQCRGFVEVVLHSPTRCDEQSMRTVLPVTSPDPQHCGRAPRCAVVHPDYCRAVVVLLSWGALPVLVVSEAPAFS